MRCSPHSFFRVQTLLFLQGVILKIQITASTAAPDAPNDLKSLPLPEVAKKLESSPDGLTQAEAQKRLTQYGPNELLGSNPVDD
jgi:Cation transporter/ATPase, N-terminus